MFKSARLKLTLFYLVVIVFMSLSLTIGIRFVAQSTYRNSDDAQRTNMRAYIRSQVGIPIPNNGFSTFENEADSVFAHTLDNYILYINLIAFVVGGMASYWFAGRTLEPIEKAHEEQARFASDASHELKTPLTVMRTEDEVFLRQASFSEKDARDQIKSNLEEIQRLEQLTNNLLALSKYEQGESLTLGQLKASDVTKQTIDHITKIQPKEAKRVETDVQDGHLVGHQDSLVEILAIFIDNALKYSPAKEPVKLIGRRENGTYTFSVEDHGPGIDVNDMPYIFDRLYRGDKARSNLTSGHGLGLSLAKEIALANHAGLNVSNIPTGGARFNLSLETSK